MSVWNYVVTAHKPNSVSHSCVGNFTSPRDFNLIIAKCTRLEIHLLLPRGLQLMLDVPIYGRIATLELFRLRSEEQDFLFIATERYKFCILQWDAKTSKLVTREMGDVSNLGSPVNSQIGIVDPDCRLIGLHLYEGLFKVIPFDDKGQLKEAFNIRLKEIQVLDIKFLFGCPKPTIAVLYQDNEDARHVKTYEVPLKGKKRPLKVKDFDGEPWYQDNVDSGTNLLIPLPWPLGGVLIVGKESIVYCCKNALEKFPISPSIIFSKAYGRIGADCFSYLLGDLAGNLHLLDVVHEGRKVTGLKITKLGETSIASTISYINDAFVYVGSSSCDSQLVKLNWHLESKEPYIEVVERFVNLGPITDFCVVDVEEQAQGRVVTCSGAYNNGSLHVVRNGIVINEQASVKLQGVEGMWSLRSSTDDCYGTFLVVGFMSKTRILAMNLEGELEDTEISGFCNQEKTLFCHDAIYNQLVQVTSSSVRLVSSSTREIQHVWHSPLRIKVATANASQVLLATDVGHLVYLEIGHGLLIEVKHSQLEYEISCLDISPTGEDPNCSKLAAVGMQTDTSIRLFSLPDLNVITKEHVGSEIVSCSVLLCSFEGISYLLCALGDGHLLNFLWNMDLRKLTDRKVVSLGARPTILCTFSMKNATHVFAVSDRAIVIYSNNKKLLYSNINLKEVSHICQFNCAAFPKSLAIAKEGELMIGTTDDISKLHIYSKHLEEHPCRICHQKQSRTLAICSLKYIQSSGADPGESFIHLLDDTKFQFMSTYALGTFELGSSILSCKFNDDSNVYYCVGTSYALPGESEPSKGRILVFVVKDNKKLRLVAEKETEGAVYSLNSFNGKLLAAINYKIQLYKWMLRDDGSRELQFECGDANHILAFNVQTRGDFIVVGDLMKSISLLIYKHEEGAIEERACAYKASSITAVEILDGDIYLGAERSCNLVTVRKNSEGATDEEQGYLEVVGQYHLGEMVNQFRHGSLVTRLPYSGVGRIPTVIFGTDTGTIGVIASLPRDQYVFLEKLQSNLRKEIEGVGGLSHEEWRSWYRERRTEEKDARNFLDGDLIESFLDLSRGKMDNVSKAMGVSVEELCSRVEELTWLH